MRMRFGSAADIGFLLVAFGAAPGCGGGGTPSDSGSSDTITGGDGMAADGGDGGSTDVMAGGDGRPADAMSGGDGGGDASCTIGTTGNDWVYQSVQFHGANRMFAPVAVIPSGIWFSSMTQGVLALTGFDSSGQETAGGIVGMTGPTTIGNVLFDGSSNADTMVTAQPVFVRGLLSTTAGLVALTNDQYFVSSTDMGSTFTAGPSYINAQNMQVWIGPTTNGWVAIDHGAHVYKTTSTTIGPSTTWTSTAIQCSPYISTGAAWVSPDGTTMLDANATYQSGASAAQICRSTTAGMTWSVQNLPNSPPDMGAGWQPVNLFVFSDALHGLAIGSGTNPVNATYVYYTSNSGAVWTPSMLPALGPLVRPISVGITAAWYAPDGQHVWMAGIYSPNASTLEPLLYASSDGGQTFTDISAAYKTALMNLFPMFQYATPRAGFALDATHIWIAGDAKFFNECAGSAEDQAFVMYSPNGGM